MTDHTTAAQAAHTNPLSDEYVNAVIQQHGYQSPETVIARLNQWIGLHGGENSVTLLMYEAHKVLSKLRATVSAERQGDIAAALQDSAYCAGLQRGFVLGNHNDNDGLRRALESRDGYVKTIKDARAALASAPVAGEAVYTLSVKGVFHNWKPTTAAFSIPDGEHQLFLRPAAPQASEAVDVESAAMKMAECMDYPWAEMPEQGRAHMRKFAQSVLDAALSAQPGAQKEQSDA